MYKKVSVAVFAFIFSCSALAQKIKKYGDWSSDMTIAGYQLASTTNANKSIAGVICALNNESCDAFISPGVSCEDGDTYPAMINSSVGSYILTTNCMHIGKLQLLVAKDFQIMIQAFESGGEVGFALPMQGGNFRVFRFSTIGATPAIKDARSLPAENKGQGTKSKNTSDDVL